MFNFIFEGRRSGKTIELIKKSAADQIPIGVWGKDRVDSILLIANEMGLIIPRPIDLYDHIKKSEADHEKNNK